MVIQYIGSAIVAGVVALLTLLLNRHWAVKDRSCSEEGAILERIDEVAKKLDDHIQMDDERAADAHRARILRFNNELLRNIPHTREEFIEVLAEQDAYEKYCREHMDYKNNRAVHAIANINRVYDERIQKNDFL